MDGTALSDSCPRLEWMNQAMTDEATVPRSRTLPMKEGVKNGSPRSPSMRRKRSAMAALPKAPEKTYEKSRSFGEALDCLVVMERHPV
jgi:hypothetical protein